MTTLRQAAQQALEALEMLARYENPETKIQVRKPKDGGPIVTMYPHKVATDAGVALRTAIAEAEKQEPVAWMFQHDETGRMNYVSNDGMNTPELFLKRNPRYALVCPLYTTPPAPKREWSGLTEEEILSDDILRYYYGMNGGAGPVSQKGKKVVAAIEAKLKEKNT